MKIFFISLLLHDLGADDAVAIVVRPHLPVGWQIEVDHRDDVETLVTQDSRAVDERIVDAVEQLYVAAIE